MVRIFNSSLTSKQKWCLLPIVVLLSALLSFLATGINQTHYTNLGILLYVLPIPLLLYSLSVDNCTAFIAILLTAILQTLASGYLYFASVIPNSVIIVMLLINSLPFLVTILIARYIILNYKGVLSIFAYPAALIVCAYIQTLISNGDLTNTTAYAQFDYKTIIQMASLTGFWGIDYLPALVASGITLVIFYRGRLTKIACLLVLLLVVIIYLVYGHWYLQQPGSSTSFKIGLAAHDPIKFDPILEKDNSAYTEKHLTHYLQRDQHLAELGATYLLQPEMSILINPAQQSHFLQQLSTFSEKYKVYTFNPIGYLERPQQTNSLTVISPNGKIIANYNKQHLVSGFENTLSSGKDLSFVYPANIKIGLAICHDMDFITPARSYGINHTQILFVPAVDFGVKVDGWWHARMAMLQAVANGYSLARAGLQGYLTVSDFHGRVLAEKATQTNQAVFVVSELHPSLGKATFYSRYPAAFPLVNGIILLFLLTLAIIKKKP
jgi:apolipoprotein N-acyltransferase